MAVKVDINNLEVAIGISCGEYGDVCIPGHRGRTDRR